MTPLKTIISTNDTCEPLYTGFEAFKDYDTQLEKAVLAACMIDTYAYSKVHGVLNADCFYITAHKKVYAAIVQVWEYGEPIDLITVTRRLFDNNIATLEHNNAAYYLSSLCRDVISSAHMQHWCVKLRELAARRMMITLTSTRFSGDDVLEGAEDIQQKLQEALHVRQATDWLTSSKAAIDLIDHMDNITSNGVAGISTGFPTLDRANGGFQSGQLVVIGARPSVGKSALMGGIAVTAAKSGHKVGIISLEMPAKDVFGRIVSRETNVDFSDIDRHGLHSEEVRAIVSNAISYYAELPIYFSDVATCTIYDIRAKAEQLKRRHGLDILMVDYLQLIEETDKYRSREQGIAQISRGLKLLAMNLEIPVIALSQLNRESEHRANKKPTMADLRESGAIEQDADIVMLLHRDWRAGITQDEFGNSTEHQADLLIYKWRNGSPQDLKLHFKATTMSFSEAA